MPSSIHVSSATHCDTAHTLGTGETQRDGAYPDVARTKTLHATPRSAQRAAERDARDARGTRFPARYTVPPGDQHAVEGDARGAQFPARHAAPPGGQHATEHGSARQSTTNGFRRDTPPAVQHRRAPRARQSATHAARGFRRDT